MSQDPGASLEAYDTLRRRVVTEGARRRLPGWLGEDRSVGRRTNVA
jgi:hypothetical protein